MRDYKLYLYDINAGGVGPSKVLGFMGKFQRKSVLV